MLAWMNFSDMRGDEGREWFRCSDLIDAALKAGKAMTRYEIHKVIAHLPPPTCKRYGHWHYTREHYDAVVAAVREEMEVLS